jgi:hypothetical protein
VGMTTAFMCRSFGTRKYGQPYGIVGLWAIAGDVLISKKRDAHCQGSMV